ncbi:hypothetical protein AVEN_130729-1 [Araneus ventricosus]|uniref:Uncharacterized protein n=1 Tax=Araneus ventricosus TaxID=182803 RepID=A0A4Y2N1X6_ARAVE|nr:hypothetical protein AVEN_130729-1 [Araneus ventricosus]
MLTNLHVLDLPESEKHNLGIMSVREHDNSKTIRATGMKFGCRMTRQSEELTLEHTTDHGRSNPSSDPYQPYPPSLKMSPEELYEPYMNIVAQSLTVGVWCKQSNTQDSGE